MGADSMSKYRARLNWEGPFGGKKSRMSEGAWGMPICSSMEATEAEVMVPVLVLSRTSKDSRRVWRSGGGTFL